MTGWLLSYIGSNYALIAVVVLAVVALGALAWFTRNWKAAFAAIVILAAGLAYQQIDKNAYERRVSEEAAAQVKALEARLALVNMANKAYADKAAEDADDLERLRDVASETPANDKLAIPEDSAERIGRVR